jgi:hypothetical protein
VCLAFFHSWSGLLSFSEKAENLCGFTDFPAWLFFRLLFIIASFLHLYNRKLAFFEKISKSSSACALLYHNLRPIATPLRLRRFAALAHSSAENGVFPYLQITAGML